MPVNWDEFEAVDEFEPVEEKPHGFRRAISDLLTKPPEVRPDQLPKFDPNIPPPPPGGYLREPSLLDRFRMTDVGRRLMGPTQAEIEGMGGAPGSAVSPVDLAQTALKFTSPGLPPVKRAVEAVTDPLLAPLPPVVRGVGKGLREAVLGMPMAPLGGGAAAKAALAAFGAEYLSTVPEQKAQFQAAVERGDWETAGKIGAANVANVAMLGAGAAHTVEPPAIKLSRLIDAAASESRPQSLDVGATVDAGRDKIIVSPEGKKAEPPPGAVTPETKLPEAAPEPPAPAPAEPVAPAIENFQKLLESPTEKVNNKHSQEAGLAAKSVADLDRFAAMREKIQTTRDEVKKAMASGNMSPEVMNKGMRAGMTVQFPREAIEAATNTGSWVEGEGALKIGERPLDWRKNPEVAEWLRKNGERMGITLPEELLKKTEAKVEPPKETQPTPGKAEEAGTAGGEPKAATVPETAPEAVTAAAYKDASGKVHTGESHPEILNRLGIEGKETKESRETPQFGFQTTKQPFVSREEAANIEGKPGGVLHSSDVAPKLSAPVSTPTQPGEIDVASVSAALKGKKVSMERLRDDGTTFTEKGVDAQKEFQDHVKRHDFLSKLLDCLRA